MQVSSFLLLFLLLMITMLCFFSFFSIAFDFIKIRHGVVVHKGQEQLKCNNVLHLLVSSLRTRYIKLMPIESLLKMAVDTFGYQILAKRMDHNLLGFNYVDCWFTKLFLDGLDSFGDTHHKTTCKK
jgi:hypothetical protein